MLPWTSWATTEVERSAAHAPQVSEHSVDDREAILIFLWVVDNRLDNLALRPRHDDRGSCWVNVRQPVPHPLGVSPGKVLM